MRISSDRIGGVPEAHLGGAQDHREGTSQPWQLGPSGDPRVRAADEPPATASASAEEVRWGLAAARAAGDLPDPRLALLASEVSAGRYWIDAREVAAALLEDLRDGQLAGMGSRDLGA